MKLSSSKASTNNCAVSLLNSADFAVSGLANQHARPVRASLEPRSFARITGCSAPAPSVLLQLVSQPAYPSLGLPNATGPSHSGCPSRQLRVAISRLSSSQSQSPPFTTPL